MCLSWTPLSLYHLTVINVGRTELVVCSETKQWNTTCITTCDVWHQTTQNDNIHVQRSLCFKETYSVGGEQGWVSVWFNLISWTMCWQCNNGCLGSWRWQRCILGEAFLLKLRLSCREKTLNPCIHLQCQHNEWMFVCVKGSQVRATGLLLMDHEGSSSTRLHNECNAELCKRLQLCIANWIVHHLNHIMTNNGNCRSPADQDSLSPVVMKQADR